MSDLTPGTTFAPGQLVTAEILNRLVSDATINEGSIKNTHIGAEMINSQATLTQATLSPDDYFLVYDSSEGDYKKVKKSDLAEVNNTQYTGGMITGDDGTETIIDSATGNITLLSGSIELKEGSITTPSATLKGGDLMLDTGNLYINGTGDGEGNLDIKGKLYANNIVGNVSLEGNLSGSGSITSSSTIYASGALSSGTSLSAPTLTLTGSLTAGGASVSSLSSTGDISGANGTLTGTLGVTGNITTQGFISATGNITSGGSLISKDCLLTEDLTLGGGISASGNIGGARIDGTHIKASQTIEALGDATFKGAVFGDNQVDISKNIVMKAETSLNAGDGSKLYTDEIQVNTINDRNTGQIKIDSGVEATGWISAKGGLTAENNLWVYAGDDPTDPEASTSAILYSPGITWHFLGDGVSSFQHLYEPRRTIEGASQILTQITPGDSSNSPKYTILGTGGNNNDLWFNFSGRMDVRREGMAEQYWGVYADSTAVDPSIVWRKVQTSQIQSTTATEYTTGKLILHQDFAWKANDFMGADILYDFGTTSTPFHMRCRGNFSTSGTKNFKIAHPAEKGMELRHCAIEAPKADLIYRGKAQLSQGKVSVNINEATHMCEDTFVKLVRDVQVFVQNNETWDQVRASVDGNIITIESQNAESNANIEWMVVAERYDPDYRKTLIKDKYETCVPSIGEVSFSTPK